MNRWHFLAFLILVLGIPWMWANRVPAEAKTDFSVPQPALDHPAPDFTLTTLDGEEFALSAQQGTPIVLNFWATWCGPCQNEMPALQTASERFGGRVQIVGVDQGETAEVVARFAEEMGITFAMPIDTEMAVGELYGVRAMPTTFFIDRNGVIRHIYLGEMNSVTIAEGIAEILR
ncbi:MAG: TlpA family protein disulfide reductase [Caldilineaceae bacterium]|nr:TlpA family protein disulfide reductase [Caldilineaceae bacterium]